jgi:PAS domain S-box-containing protein
VGAIERLAQRAGSSGAPEVDLFERAAALCWDLIYLYDTVEQRAVYRSRPDVPVVWLSLDRPGQIERHSVHPADLPALRLHRARLEGSAEGAVAEVRFRVPVGRDRHQWLASRETVVARRPDGGVRRLLGTVRALTLPESEDAVRDSEERLRLATSLAGVGTWDWDLRTDRAVNSESYFRLYGLAPSSRPPSMDEWLERVHPDDRARMRALTERGLRDGTLPETEFRVVWPDGSVHWLLGKGHVLHDADGRRVRMIGVNLEITERKRAELELRTSEARYRSLVAATSAIVWTTDAIGRFVEPQPSWEAFTGQTWREYSGAGRLRAVHPGDRRTVAQAWGEALRDRAIYETEGRIWHAPSGEYRHCWTRAVPMLDDAGAIREWFGCVLDVTDRWRAQAEISRLNETLEQRVAERTQQLAEANRQLREQIAERRQAEEALRQSQKIEAVGRLTGGVAHDFNNLLTIILGNLELLERLVGEGTALRHVRSAAHAAERGAKLAEQLLAFSRKQRLSPKPVDIDGLVAGMQELLQRTLGTLIVIEIRRGAAPWSAMADANQVELVILNLAINARDAMEAGGNLTIATSNVTLAAGDDPELAKGDYVLIEVADTGSGMSEEVRTRAFEPFFTTKEVGKGSGLGLSMVYGVAAQLGGTVRIDSKVGAGTTVRVYLPRAPIAPAGAAAAAPRDLAPVVPGATILLVDDDRDVRTVTAATLRNLGYRVVESADGPSALERLAELGNVALLLVDLGMPGMDGLEVARRARQLCPGLAVLVSTGYAEDGTFSGPLDHEIVLKKPYRAQDLATHIEDALARPRPGRAADQRFSSS